MLGKSEREKRYNEMIERLKNNKELRADIEIPDDVFKNVAEPDNLKLLIEHRRYLANERKKADEEKKKEFDAEIFKINQYMLMAEFGDRNIGRFNGVTDV